jgi:hypothetical protein
MRSSIAISAVAFLAGALAWQAVAPLSAWAVGGSHRVVVENNSKPLTSEEVRRIERYMQQVFANQEIRLSHTPPDAEVHLGEHFLGIVYSEDQRDGRTFYFEMAIFEEEAAESPPQKRSR